MEGGLTLQVFFPKDQLLVLSLELLLPDIELTLRLLRLIEGALQAVLLAAKGRNYLTLLPILTLCGRIKVFFGFTWNQDTVKILIFVMAQFSMLL